MRLFRLERTEDASGVSGIGKVAEGVVFDDGTVVLRWLTEVKSTVFSKVSRTWSPSTATRERPGSSMGERRRIGAISAGNQAVGQHYVFLYPHEGVWSGASSKSLTALQWRIRFSCNEPSHSAEGIEGCRR
jgi:hypothetical protein